MGCFASKNKKHGEKPGPPSDLNTAVQPITNPDDDKTNSKRKKGKSSAKDPAKGIQPNKAVASESDGNKLHPECQTQEMTKGSTIYISDEFRTNGEETTADNQIKVE